MLHALIRRASGGSVHKEMGLGKAKRRSEDEVCSRMATTREQYVDPDAECLKEVSIQMQGEFEFAAWEDLVKYYAAVGKDQFCEDLKLEPSSAHNEKLLFVSRRNTLFYSGKRRYFLQRFDGRVPVNWMTHASIDNNTVCLGYHPHHSKRRFAQQTHFCREHRTRHSRCDDDASSSSRAHMRFIPRGKPLH